MCYVARCATSPAAREASMRPLMLSVFLITVAVLAETPVASAQSPYSYPWCAQTGKDYGATSCYFTSYQQCRSTVSGVGGYCFQSPYYHATPANGPMHHR